MSNVSGPLPRATCCALFCRAARALLTSLSCGGTESFPSKTRGYKTDGQIVFPFFWRGPRLRGLGFEVPPPSVGLLPEPFPIREYRIQSAKIVQNTFLAKTKGKSMSFWLSLAPCPLLAGLRPFIPLSYQRALSRVSLFDLLLFVRVSSCPPHVASLALSAPSPSSRQTAEVLVRTAWVLGGGCQEGRAWQKKKIRASPHAFLALSLFRPPPEPGS